MTNRYKPDALATNPLNPEEERVAADLGGIVGGIPSGGDRKSQAEKPITAACYYRRYLKGAGLSVHEFALGVSGS